MVKLVVLVSKQEAQLWISQELIKTFNISTARNGLSCLENSFCTPPGALKVAKKIGDHCAYGAVFRSRIPTGEVWDGQFSEEDFVLTRILWLEGAEERNSNTIDRFIYLHGTNQENRLGTPVSHGCIRFSNRDIIEIFQIMNIGDEVIVEE